MSYVYSTVQGDSGVFGGCHIGASQVSLILVTGVSLVVCGAGNGGLLLLCLCALPVQGVSE